MKISADPDKSALVFSLVANTEIVQFDDNVTILEISSQNHL